MARSTAARFSSRLREALSRFSDGVHDIAAPANAIELERVGLPESMRELYLYANGLWLFDDLVRVLPLGEIKRHGALVEYGRVEGARLLADLEGRAFELDEDDDRILAAGSVEDDLLARVARESLLIDNDGEWREVVGPDGALLPAIVRKRNDVARRRAPGSARWVLEAAELALEQDGEPEALLIEASQYDPEAPAPAELHGLLLSGRGELEAGARSLIRAAEHSGPPRRAERAAIAAEAAQRAGLGDERARMAELAITHEVGIAMRLAEEAEQSLAAGRIEDGDRLASLARAVAGEGAVSTRLRVRDRLKPVR